MTVNEKKIKTLNTLDKKTNSKNEGVTNLITLIGQIKKNSHENITINRLNKTMYI